MLPTYFAITGIDKECTCVKKYYAIKLRKKSKDVVKRDVGEMESKLVFQTI